jgi:hypothetical protein
MSNRRLREFYLALVSALAAIAILCTAFPAFADPKELEDIRAAIKAKGGKWVADVTPVSELTLEEKRTRANLDLDEEAALALAEPNPDTMGDTGTPDASLDWRNHSGIGYVTPVKNQGGCGSCWAFAATAALESQVLLYTGGTTVPPPTDIINISEQILVSCSGAGSCSGGSPTSASTYIKTTGLPVESCFPYTGTNSTCSNACANWQGSTYKILGWHNAATSGSLTVDDIRRGVFYYGPIIAGFYVYNDFYSYHSGIYSYSTGSYVGAHAVLVGGYDDAGQYFIVKNSWGGGWGEAGYFRIAYSEVTGQSRFGYFSMAYDGYPGGTPAPLPEPPCNYALSPTSKTFKSPGGSASVSVSCGATCDWTVINGDPSWVGVTSASAAGSGSGVVNYTVAENTTKATRSTTLKIGGVTHTVSQQGVKGTGKLVK